MNVVNLTETADRASWARAVKAVAVVYCVVLPAIVAGMTMVSSVFHEPLSGGEDLRLGLTLAALLLAPGILYAALVRTNVVMVVAGGGLVVLQTWSVWAATTGTASTAGLAILWIPFLGVPLVLVGWAVDVWVRAGQPLSPPP